MARMYDPDNLGNRRAETIERILPLIDGFFRRYHRATVRGLDRLPRGPALLVGNHSGASLSIDTFLFAAALIKERGVDALPFGLAHDFVLRLPVLNPLLSEIGAVRACEENAHRLFALGRQVMKKFRSLRAGVLSGSWRL